LLIGVSSNNNGEARLGMRPPGCRAAFFDFAKKSVEAIFVVGAVQYIYLFRQLKLEVCKISDLGQIKVR